MTSATNGQIAVDEASQMIVATGLTNCAADHGELLPLLDRTQATLGRYPTDVLADAGYKGEATFQTLETRQVTASISLAREGTLPAPPSPKLEATQRMATRLASEEGRARYRRRKAIVEPVFAGSKKCSVSAASICAAKPRCAASGTSCASLSI